MTRLIVHCDGASRGNPGEAAVGVALLDEAGAIVGRAALRLGVMTNNQAEYHAVLAGARLAGLLGGTDVLFRLDSELTVRQLKGEWKVKNAALAALRERVREALSDDMVVSYEHVPRGANAMADRLANWALDKTRADHSALP